MLLAPAIMAVAVLHDLINGQMLQSDICGQLLAMTSLTHARRAGDDYIGVGSRHVYGVRSG
jgi:hypothetical protein